MAIRNLLYKNSIPINDSISIIIPTVGEILECEDLYYGAISLLTAMPIDMMVQLDDIGVDFSLINEYDLFLLTFEGLKTLDTSLIFGDLDLTKFQLTKNEQNGTLMYEDKENNIRIDRAIYNQIASYLRLIHNLKKDRRKPANGDAKEFMLKRARDKLKRNKHKTQNSELESLIVAMVNTEQYKYNYEETKNLSIYQFNESVQQIINKIEYDNRMHGVYAGTVSVKDLSPKDLNWLSHK